ncbi:MAG: TnsA endonuclease N-terminal domain-containing protein [Bacteroidales bacterium]|jgi:hypothetical protein|nr:TnsA endonuclease N-terminal domain-containing protein [Bacteroidales bacterium]
MAKHRRKWNESVYRKYLCEGRGQGTGASYIPWLFVQDFPSKGMVSRVRGAKTGRIHHLMSDLETSFFFILDWSEAVLDIREQYPLLDLRQIIEIAETAQIRYPYDRQSGFPYVMTSDFYIETVNGPAVIAIKPSSDLENPRIREKLEIERRYWHKQNIRWRVVTENEISIIKARNIEWLSQAKDLGCLGISKERQTLCNAYFKARHTCGVSLCDLFKETETKFNLAPGAGLNVYKHLAYWKCIEVNVGETMDFADFMQSVAECARGS